MAACSAKEWQSLGLPRKSRPSWSQCSRAAGSSGGHWGWGCVHRAPAGTPGPPPAPQQQHQQHQRYHQQQHHQQHVPVPTPRRPARSMAHSGLMPLAATSSAVLSPPRPRELQRVREPREPGNLASSRSCRSALASRWVETRSTHCTL